MPPCPSSTLPPDTPILSVSRLVDLLKEVIEDNLAQVWLRGELCNLSRPASGHWYFALKDDTSLIRAVMFRSANRTVSFLPANGQQVLCCGRASLYRERGDVQLLIDRMEPDGIGSLQLAFEQLKARLQQEGLFATERKKPLPPYPGSIGLITSASGAVLHDIRTVLRRRAAGVRLILRPVLVQGEQAAEQICQALADFNRLAQTDVLILARGGGSLEDLQAFNDERVARAIAASRLPVISAIGHETDYSIADFVADLRAPTPSAAAELVVRNRCELEQHLDQLDGRLRRGLRGRLQQTRQQLDALQRRLRHPRQTLQWQRDRLHWLRAGLQQALQKQLDRRHQQLALACQRLDGLSPLRILARGYTLVEQDDVQARPLSQATGLLAGQRVWLRFHDGRIPARLEQDGPAQHP